MKTLMKNFAKNLVKKTPYSISRKPSNVFDSIYEVLERISNNGYRPKLIVDGGAHLGDFAKEAAVLFPEAKIHMFEPQQACASRLESLSQQERFEFFPVGLGASNSTAQLATGVGPDSGASIAYDGSAGTVEIPIRTLDSFYANNTVPNNSLMKLDLQGHELEALKGANKSLQNFELILTEVSFYKQVREPSPNEIISYLESQGFVLVNILALIARPRDGRLRQGDFLFARKDSSFSTDTRWD